MNFLIHVHFKIHNKVHNCKKMSLGNKLVLQYNLQIIFLIVEWKLWLYSQKQKEMFCLYLNSLSSLIKGKKIRTKYI